MKNDKNGKKLSEVDEIVAAALDAAALELMDTFPEVPTHDPSDPEVTARLKAQAQAQAQQAKSIQPKQNLILGTSAGSNGKNKTASSS